MAEDPIASFTFVYSAASLANIRATSPCSATRISTLNQFSGIGMQWNWCSPPIPLIVPVEIFCHTLFGFISQTSCPIENCTNKCINKHWYKGENKTYNNFEPSALKMMNALVYCTFSVRRWSYLLSPVAATLVRISRFPVALCTDNVTGLVKSRSGR
jgi:hypothetical protein